MQTFLRGRDMMTTQEWTKEEIDTVMDVALDLKRKRAMGIPHAYLRDKVLAMLFFFSSTRTRASFEAGMAQLGGHAQFIDSKTTQIAHGDTAKELGEILGRYNDGIAIRQVDWGHGNQYMRWVAEASRAPVLNMQCDLYHPHQILADLLTIMEKKGDPRSKTITVSWAYASSYSKPMSVPQSLILLMTRYGMNVRLVHPPEFNLVPEIVEQAKSLVSGLAKRVRFVMSHATGKIEIVGKKDDAVYFKYHRAAEDTEAEAKPKKAKAAAKKAAAETSAIADLADSLPHVPPILWSILTFAAAGLLFLAFFVPWWGFTLKNLGDKEVGKATIWN